MRLYKITGETGVGTAIRKYVGTQADAAKTRKELKASGHVFIKTDEVDVPTDKAGLMAYLNDESVAQN